jgi:hypothetical protein
VHPPKKIEKDEFNSGSSSFAPLLRLLAQRGAHFLVDAPWCAFASPRRRLFQRFAGRRRVISCSPSENKSQFTWRLDL